MLSLEALAQGFAADCDATCGWRAAQWQRSHGAGDEADCRLRLTVRHAVLLQDRVREE